MRLHFFRTVMVMFFIYIAPASAADNNDVLLTSVMNRLAAVKSANADFTEKKFVRLLDAPVESTGVLIYTAAPDSEGTLGGLVSLGKPETLERHLDQALDNVRLCASDPLCAEHHPYRDGITLHAASCHACLFAPETSCERGNKYLDRAVLVSTVETGEQSDLAFFE